MPQSTRTAPVRKLLASFTIATVTYELHMEETRGVYVCFDVNRPAARTEMIGTATRAAQAFFNALDDQLAALRIICDVSPMAQRRMIGGLPDFEADAPDAPRVL